MPYRLAPAWGLCREDPNPAAILPPEHCSAHPCGGVHVTTALDRGATYREAGHPNSMMVGALVAAPGSSSSHLGSSALAAGVTAAAVDVESSALVETLEAGSVDVPHAPSRPRQPDQPALVPQPVDLVDLEASPAIAGAEVVVEVLVSSPACKEVASGWSQMIPARTVLRPAVVAAGMAWNRFAHFAHLALLMLATMRNKFGLVRCQIPRALGLALLAP